jgi:sugar lactone lactonase YvrE
MDFDEGDIMNRRLSIKWCGSSIAALLLCTLTPSAAQTIDVVMSGLDNPRGLAFGPEGGLYVVEAGSGGSGPCQTLRMAQQCYGPSGAVTRLWRGVQERVVAGLPSQVDPAGQAFGAQDISFLGRGGAYVMLGFGGEPSLRGNFGPDGTLFGTLIRASASGQWNVLADVSQFEATDDPAGGLIDSNPFGVIAQPGGRVVTDAGGNSLLFVAANGAISTIATFPSRPQRNTDAVPTGLTVGPDGAYYVGELTGAPFNAAAARVYRVVPGSAPTVFRDGFKAIVDVAFGPDGSLYVVEFAGGMTGLGAPGRLLRVLPNGTRETAVDNLDRPTSVLVDADGVIYVTNKGTSPGNGEVLRIEP